MTKQKLAKITEELVEQIAVKNGATIENIKILCGGKPQDSRMATGGKFDLNASRGILAFAITQHKDLLTGAAQAPAPEPTEENTAPSHNGATVTA